MNQTEPQNPKQITPSDGEYVPYVTPVSEAPKKEIQKLSFSDPFKWLRKGWTDLVNYKSCATFFGVCFYVMAVVLGIVFQNKPEYTMSIVSGCLLLGPFLALGLYEVSRRNELGLPKSFIQATTCWRHHIRSMGMLVLVLIVLELLWGRASLVVFAVFFNTGMPSTTGVMEAIFNPQNWEFLLVYAFVGGIFASLVFAVSVVSIPMILDRDTDAISAGITSIQVVFSNLPVMVLWGALLTLLIAISLLPWGLGLIVIGPWLGYATWHAYRGSVKWLDRA